jgi:hypothetical protein
MTAQFCEAMRTSGQLDVFAKIVSDMEKDAKEKEGVDDAKKS